MTNKLDNKKLKEFGLLISFVLPVLFGWFLPLIFDHEFKMWTLMISIPFFIISLTKPSLLFYPYKFWMKLGFILGWFNSRLILISIYILVLIPIAFIMRIFGYDPLRLKFEKKISYREIRKNSKIDLNRIF